VQGRFWFFSILMGKKYVISQPLNSEDIKDLKHIVIVLRKLKQIIQEDLMV
jgi:transcription elongation factor GreA-like protein